MPGVRGLGGGIRGHKKTICKKQNDVHDGCDVVLKMKALGGCPHAAHRMQDAQTQVNEDFYSSEVPKSPILASRSDACSTYVGKVNKFTATLPLKLN